MNRTIKSAVLMVGLFALFATVASAAQTGVLVLRLRDSQDHSYTHRAGVDAVAYRDVSVSQINQHLLAAKRAMATELGYTKALYGEDHHKVLGPVRVVGAWLEEGTRRTALGFFQSEAAREGYGD